MPEAKVTLIHVSSAIPPRDKLLEAKFDILSVLEDQAHGALKETEALFHAKGINYELEVAWGDPASEIANHAERGQFDVIVMGSRGLGRVTEVLMGSVSQRVLHESKCPVLIVK